MSIPNTLTIFINTRIRGYPKIKYEPEMTVPKIKSDTVYFNPLIKLSKSVCLKIPPSYPKTERYTQFFNKSDFNGLIGRNITSTFQKKLTLDEATKLGIVDNNINVTLDILFKKNNIFYIKDKPYTIYSHEWINGDWQVDKKSFEKQIQQLTYGEGLYGNRQNMILQNRMADDELVRFKKEHASAITGFAVSSDVSKFKDEYESGIAKGVTPTPLSNKEAIEKMKEESKTDIPKIARKLATKKLVYQNIVNLDEDANLSNDPVSINILYSIDRNYSEDIKLNQKILDPLYETLLKKGKEYKLKKEVYDKSVGEYFSLIHDVKATPPIATPVEDSNAAPTDVTTALVENDIFKNKKKYDEAVTKIREIIDNYKTRGLTYDNVANAPTIKNEILQVIVLLEKYKTQFLTSFLNSLTLLVNKIYAQINYIRALYAFYSQLYIVKEANFKLNKTEFEHQNILKLNIIKFDVQCYKNIINNIETSENFPLSTTLKTIINTVSYVKEFIQRENAIQKNYTEILRVYYEHPNILQINRYQFDVYMFTLLKYDFTIDLGMWKILYRQTDLFLNNIKDYIVGSNNGSNVIQGKISIAKILLDQYNEKYTQQQRDAFNKNLSRLNTPLQKQNSHMLDFAFPETSALKQQQNDYIRYQKAITLCYDLITVYSRISAIKYSREISLVSARQNLSYVVDKIYKRMNKTYSEILKDNPVNRLIPLIPNYIYLSSDSYKDVATLNNNIKINNNALITNKQKKSGYKILLQMLRKKYHSAVDILIPQISKLGILEKCKQLVGDDDELDNDSESDAESIYDDPSGKPLTPGEVIKKSYQQTFQRFYDNDNSVILRKHIANLYESGITIGVLNQINPEEIDKNVLKWSVIDNPGGGDCLFYAVSMIFNNELINNNNKSNNQFADQTGYFSKTSLRQAIADPIYGIQEIDTEGWNDIIRPQIEGINEADPRADPNMLQLRREYSFLFDERGNWIGDNINVLRNVIKSDGRYWGDDVALKILERIFKIKFIVIDTTIPDVFPTGAKVRFTPNGGDEEKYGVVVKSARVRNRNEYVYDIADSNNSARRYLAQSSVHDNVTLSEDGYYRVVSFGSDNAAANDFAQYAFLLLTQASSGAQHYEIMYSSELKKFVYTFDEIPDYLKYFVYTSQWKYLNVVDRNHVWYRNNAVFHNYLTTTDANITSHNAKKKTGRVKKSSGGSLNEFENENEEVSQLEDNSSLSGGQISNRNRYVNVYNTNNSRFDDSKLSYYVIIDLELYPGESIPLSKQPVIACHLKYEKIRKAFADTFGLVYNPIDFYQKDHIAPSSVKYRKEGEPRSGEAKQYPGYPNYPNYPQNYNTRNFRVSYSGGKRTRKNYNY